MAKAPPNLAGRKDRVKRRGRNDGRQGILEKMDEETLWATVSWDDGAGPHMVHLYEVERVDCSS